MISGDGSPLGRRHHHHNLIVLFLFFVVVVIAAAINRYPGRPPPSYPLLTSFLPTRQKDFLCANKETSFLSNDNGDNYLTLFKRQTDKPKQSSLSHDGNFLSPK